MSALGNRGFQNSLSVGLPILRPLVDGTMCGSFWVCLARVVGTRATVFAHKLGRSPSGWIPWNNEVGGVLYADETDMAAWTPTSFTLRATIAGTYGFLIG